MNKGCDLIVGIDAGTSVIKAVAFDLGGRQIASFPVRNSYVVGRDGSASQSMNRTWDDSVAAVVGLADRVDGLAERTAAVALTGQGDGTWLVGPGSEPVSDAWIWLDARAAPTVSSLLKGQNEGSRFMLTGTGLNTCQQGSQLAHMAVHEPEMLGSAEVALHCKDWLFLKFTGQRATDPSEACFTFGDFRTRQYSDRVIEALGLEQFRHLLPEIIEGTEQNFPLTADAAKATGLTAGTPVVLGYVDMAMTALGAGVRTEKTGSACSIVGSTGVHMYSKEARAVQLNDNGTGYVICLPVPGIVTEVQTNMAATLNIDWVLSVAGELVSEFGASATHQDLVAHMDKWLAASEPGQIVYHPYISEAGERGPFVDAAARASLIGLNSTHRFPNIIRAIIEGLGMAARDCYRAMDAQPQELRLTGGASRSRALRQILAAAVNSPVRLSTREEAGSAGAAMMAAVSVGIYRDMDACIADWTTPLLGDVEMPDPKLVSTYEGLFAPYKASRRALAPVWEQLAHHHGAALHSDDQSTARSPEGEAV
ncbi:MAG: carbohydrate kinase [Alphaproteobacteria bacterium]|nr:carbohydrate kinase [Alphaproteobacteria bacterium]